MGSGILLSFFSWEKPEFFKHLIQVFIKIKKKKKEEEEDKNYSLYIYIKPKPLKLPQFSTSAQY